MTLKFYYFVQILCIYSVKNTCIINSFFGVVLGTKDPWKHSLDWYIRAHFHPAIFLFSAIHLCSAWKSTLTIQESFWCTWSLHFGFYRYCFIVMCLHHQCVHLIMLCLLTPTEGNVFISSGWFNPDLKYIGTNTYNGK